jgi:hypothetical protein
MGVDARLSRHEPKGLTPRCDVVTALRSQIHQVHRLLEDQVGAAAERARSASTADSEVVSLYVHALCIEDITVNLLLRHMPPLFTSTWIGGHLEPWDLTSAQGYAEVVHAATEVLLCRLTPADLRSAIDLSDAGLGKPDVNWVLNRFLLWEIAMICGELAARPAERRRVAVSRRLNGKHAVASRNGHSNGVSVDSIKNSKWRTTASHSAQGSPEPQK